MGKWFLLSVLLNPESIWQDGMVITDNRFFFLSHWGLSLFWYFYYKLLNISCVPTFQMYTYTSSLPVMRTTSGRGLIIFFKNGQNKKKCIKLLLFFFFFQQAFEDIEPSKNNR